jgi:hypothetical protein
MQGEKGFLSIVRASENIRNTVVFSHMFSVHLSQFPYYKTNFEAAISLCRINPYDKIRQARIAEKYVL